MKKYLQLVNVAASPPAVRLGFVPLNDCAPLVMAQELGFFRRYGLRVQLSKELGWATIRDKIIYGELQAAHAVAGLPFAATLGIGSVRCDCVAALVLNLHGNAITVSKELWAKGLRDGVTLRHIIARWRGARTFTFGAVFPVSSHHFLLRKWLEASNAVPGPDVQIVIVPPAQMAANLQARHLDGFCVGEPWNSVAIQSQAGCCVAVSAELDPGHPEKVLMVRRDFVERRHEEHLALVAALLDACEWCAAPENREQLIATLARREYVNVPPAALRPGLEGNFDFGEGQLRRIPDFCLFTGYGANDPSADKAAWILQRLKSLSPPNAPLLNAEFGRRVFRTDLFEEAIRLRESRPVNAPANFRSATTPCASPAT